MIRLRRDEGGVGREEGYVREPWAVAPRREEIDRLIDEEGRIAVIRRIDSGSKGLSLVFMALYR